MLQNTENRLSTAFQKQNEKIEYFCSAENVSPNLAVHEIRKSFKRLRALLKFFSDYTEDFPTQYKIQIQDFGHFLSPVRESFINLQIFERITTGEILIPERKVKEVKDILAAKNKFLIEEKFLKEKNCLTFQENCKDLDSYLLLKANAPLSMKQFYVQVSSSFLKSYENHKLLETDFNPINLHDLRKKLKALWYQIDFLQFLHPRYFKLKSIQLNKITEQLGEDHDLFVFLNELKTGDYSFSSEELMILENQVENLRELNQLKLTPRLRQFFTETPELFNQKMQKIFKIE